MSTGSVLTIVKAVWRREQVVRFTEGALAFVAWATVLLLGAVLVDWLAGKWVGDIPAPGRACILLAALATAGLKAWAAGWKHLGPFNATRTALQIEESRGGMQSLLVTAIQLQDQAKRQGTSDALCELICRKAAESAGAIRPGTTIRLQGLRRPAAAVALVVLLAGLLAVTQWPLLKVGLVRNLPPWSSAGYPTRTLLVLKSGDMVVQEGKPVVISAALSGAVPAQASLSIRTGPGRPRTRAMPIVKGACQYVFETAFRGFEYRVAAGDARSAWHTVEVINAPNIKQATIELEFPDYTRRPTESAEALNLTVPESTLIKWKLSLDRAVGKATLNLAGQDPVSLDISGDGLTVSMSRVASESSAYSFTWVERGHGFVFTSPNYYLQVSPDTAPRVELTAPARNLSATLGRKLDLAFRGRDDHGVAECKVAYRVDKTAEETIGFTPLDPVDGKDQVIPWDYRTVLTNLAVGQAVTFAVELTDRYPGENGPHRVRSEARRIQFMSQEEYLEQVEKQKNRLLSQLKAIYKEEREVHETILRLDRANPAFVQTCQLEAVRQDMMRERLRNLAGQMGELTADLEANSITNKVLTDSLEQFRMSLLSIAGEQVLKAAEELRVLAGNDVRKGNEGVQQDRAANRVNQSARELGLLVFQLGFTDAADVMSRELRSAAQTQAALRLRTVTRDGDSAGLAEAQEQLGQWLDRLFAAAPRGKESTLQDALTEFTLTRLVKQLVNNGVARQLQEAAGLIRNQDVKEAAQRQTQVIAALMKAEFRLRLGAENEALAKALELLNSQAEAQKTLRLEAKALDDKLFQKRRNDLVRAQSALQRKLKLLLMPSVPASRMRLMDDQVPTPPPVSDLLLQVDEAMELAATQLKKGDRAAAEAAQLRVEKALATLVEIAGRRSSDLTQAVRLDRLTYGTKELDEKLGRFSERQVGLLAKFEDADADRTPAAFLAEPQESLAVAVESFRLDLLEGTAKSGASTDIAQSLPGRLDEALFAMRKAVQSLNTNKPGDAVVFGDAALSALSGSRGLLGEYGSNITAFAAIVGSTRTALIPSQYVAEIVEEQQDMLALTRNTGKDDLPGLAIAQKNLVHAVNATLAALEPLNHLAESGTVMLFAKDDMDSSGTALQNKDLDEAVDAQTFIIETVGTLRGKLDAVVPQFQYLLEMTEALHEILPVGVQVRESQRLLREKVATLTEAGQMGAEQGSLKAKAESYYARIDAIAGLGLGTTSLLFMAESETLLKAGDVKGSVAAMKKAEKAMGADAGTLLTLMARLAAVLDMPAPAQPIPPEYLVMREVLVMASRQKAAYLRNSLADPGQVAGFEPKLREFEQACGPFIERARLHKNPVPPPVKPKRGAPPQVIEPAKEIPPANLQRNLEKAKSALAAAAAEAKAMDRVKSLESQKRAVVALRHFIAEYALKFYVEKPGPAPSDAPAEVAVESEDMMMLFLPGAVTGKKPADGRAEWEVLGRRERAALNENFARELPLEYRAILKNYYERLTQ